MPLLWTAALLALAYPAIARELHPRPGVYWTGKCVRAGCVARHPGIRVEEGRRELRGWRG